MSGDGWGVPPVDPKLRMRWGAPICWRAVDDLDDVEAVLARVAREGWGSPPEGATLPVIRSWLRSLARRLATENPPPARE